MMDTTARRNIIMGLCLTMNFNTGQSFQNSYAIIAFLLYKVLLRKSQTTLWPSAINFFPALAF